MGGEKGGATVDNECAGGRGDEKQEFLGVKLRKRVSLGWKGGPCTPVPNWKLEPGPSFAAAAALSARKLGANLWEMQGLSQSPLMSRRGGKASSRRKGAELIDIPDVPAVSVHRSAGSPRRRASTASIQHHKLIESIRAMRSVSPTSCGSSMEAVTPSGQALSPGSSFDLKGRLQDSGYSLKTSTELLKVLNWIWRREEQHESNASLVKELKSELQHARARIQELMQDQQTYRYEMDDMMKQVAENKLIRKNKEQDMLKEMMQSVSDELEDEKRLRQRSESLHRKLGKELSQVKLAFAEAVKDLERQRKTNVLLEKLCDEFSKGVLEYEQELRALQQKAKGDSDHKFDRLVLHMSEAWLDERLQMDQEHRDSNGKGSITDRLSGEIKNFFQARQAKNEIANQKERRKESNLRRRSLESAYLNKTISALQFAAADDDSTSSDLHCFELNMNMGDTAKPDQSKHHSSEIAEICESLWRKDTTKSRNVKKMQLIEKVLKSRHSHTDPETEAGINQIELAMSQKLEKCHLKEDSLHDKTVDNSMKNSSECSEGCKVHPFDSHAEEDSNNHLSWRGHFVPAGVGDATADVHTVLSPVQQWNHRHASPELELSECSLELSPSVEKSTLKAKLLEARLRGKNSRFK